VAEKAVLRAALLLWAMEHNEESGEIELDVLAKKLGICLPPKVSRSESR
jgi:hypothetical protein